MFDSSIFRILGGCTWLVFLLKGANHATPDFHTSSLGSPELIGRNMYKNPQKTMVFSGFSLLSLHEALVSWNLYVFPCLPASPAQDPRPTCHQPPKRPQQRQMRPRKQPSWHLRPGCISPKKWEKPGLDWIEQPPTIFCPFWVNIRYFLTCCHTLGPRSNVTLKNWTTIFI